MTNKINKEEAAEAVETPTLETRGKELHTLIVAKSAELNLGLVAELKYAPEGVIPVIVFKDLIGSTTEDKPKIEKPKKAAKK